MARLVFFALAGGLSIDDGRRLTADIALRGKDLAAEDEIRLFVLGDPAVRARLFNSSLITSGSVPYRAHARTVPIFSYSMVGFAIRMGMSLSAGLGVKTLPVMSKYSDFIKRHWAQPEKRKTRTNSREIRCLNKPYSFLPLYRGHKCSPVL